MRLAAVIRDARSPATDLSNQVHVVRDLVERRSTIVGREREQRQLQAAFEAAAAGQGGLMILVGEPGIGKTALCQEFAKYVGAHGGLSLVGHCYPEGSATLPYQPLWAFEGYARPGVGAGHLAQAWVQAIWPGLKPEQPEIFNASGMYRFDAAPEAAPA
jgi:hypothetical protein